MNSAIRYREVRFVTRGEATSDGAGVRLTRLIGSRQLDMVDPFLMLDRFDSDQPGDYIAGFPPHPHRGFETVTYLLNGRMRHQDSTGREGVIEPGGVQWMTAGRGVIHSEMPEQQEGLLAGFQLWLNLPAANKMDPAAYQEFDADSIPLERREGGTTLRVIAGTTAAQGDQAGTRGPVEQPLTDPRYFDVSVPAGQRFSEPLPSAHSAFVYIIAGSARVGKMTLPANSLAVLSAGEVFRLQAGAEDARFLFIAGKPIGEPVARGGPFVMNSEAEIRQAFADYRAGRLADSI